MKGSARLPSGPPSFLRILLGSGKAVTVEIRRQDYFRPCDHPDIRRCHAKGPDALGRFWHEVPMWHAWDDEADDYAVEPQYSAGEVRRRISVRSRR